MKHELINLDRFKNNKIACITLDLEQDHGGLLEEPSYEAFSLINSVKDYFKRMSIFLTCFVQGTIFETHPEIVDNLSKENIEFELHTYSHPEVYWIINLKCHLTTA
ncbi:MAG: polysaccharide deacetylase family protein [Methanobacteriaceae archaeon]|jgi:peptidoglycan/xylan/chitin deacetylase (PgdA/CDA1 family)